MGPSEPTYPSAPVGPAGPVGPEGPAGPVGPSEPTYPSAPVGPVGPPSELILITPPSLTKKFVLLETESIVSNFKSPATCNFAPKEDDTPTPTLPSSSIVKAPLVLLVLNTKLGYPSVVV